MSLPIDKDSQRTGRLAADLVSVWLQRNDIIVRQEGQGTDFGVDLELEIHAGQAASGSLVKCQVKGTAGPAFASGRDEYVTIKSSTQNYWATLPVNVMCILCDVSTGEIYWQPASARLAQTEHTSLRFTEAMRADADPELFKSTLTRLARTPTSSQILSLVPACLDLFRDLTLGGPSVHDAGFAVESGLDGSVRVFYDHLERLCIFTGMGELPARWDRWERRNSVIQTALDSADTGSLDGNLVGEIIRYVLPFYREALTRVERCVDPEQITRTNPVLAGMLMDDLFDDDRVAEAFKQFEEEGLFLLEPSVHYSFAEAPDAEDVDFRNHLAARGVQYYDFPTGGTTH